MRMRNLKNMYSLGIFQGLRFLVKNLSLNLEWIWKYYKSCYWTLRLIHKLRGIELDGLNI